MPYADLTGWVPPQELSGMQSSTVQATPELLASLGIPTGGNFNAADWEWNPETRKLVNKYGQGSYDYSWEALGGNPDLGTNVVLPYGYTGGNQGYGAPSGTNIGNTLAGFGDTYHFDPGENPYFGFGDGRDTFFSADPNAIDQYQHDANTRVTQGALQVGALVGGTALGSSLSGGGAGTSATTFPYASGGPVTATPLAAAGGSIIPAAGASGGMAGATGALTGAGGGFLNNWLPTIAGGVNSLLGAATANRAADAEIAAGDRAIAEQARQYDTTRQDFMPWMNAGRDALGRLQNPGASFTASPDYEFVRGEGTRGIENRFAARGGARSGNALRALAEFNSGLASQDFGNWWNRQAGLAGVGQAATGTVANAGTNAANNTSNALIGQGVSRSSGIWNRNAALGQGLNDAVSNWLYRRRSA